MGGRWVEAGCGAIVQMHQGSVGLTGHWVQACRVSVDRATAAVRGPHGLHLTPAHSPLTDMLHSGSASPPAPLPSRTWPRATGSAPSRTLATSSANRISGSGRHGACFRGQGGTAVRSPCVTTTAVSCAKSHRASLPGSRGRGLEASTAGPRASSTTLPTARV